MITYNHKLLPNYVLCQYHIPAKTASLNLRTKRKIKRVPKKVQMDECGGKTYKLITTYKCPAGIRNYIGINRINSFQSCAFSVNRRNFYNVVGVFVLNDCASAFFLSRTRLL